MKLNFILQVVQAPDVAQLPDVGAGPRPAFPETMNTPLPCSPPPSPWRARLRSSPLPSRPGATAADIRDTFNEARGTDRRHEATDILAPAALPSSR